MRFRVARQHREFETRIYSEGGERGRTGHLACEVSPDPTTEEVSLFLASNANASAQLLFAAIAQGIRQELSDCKNRGVQRCSLRITISEMQFPADSSERVLLSRGVELLRDLPADFFQTLAPPPLVLLTPDVIGLARAIAEDGTLAHPILADALEEAGCEDALVLEHLRTCEDHGPSCWVTTWLLQQRHVAPLAKDAL